MEVILKEDYISLGYIGDSVKVRRGFARNFLIPRGIAIEASSKNENQLKHKLSAIVAKRIKKKAEAEAFAKVLGQVIVEFAIKVGAKGKSFGAITSRDIEASLKNLGYNVDRRQIRVSETIKGPGVYSVEVKLHSEVVVPVQVKVIAVQPPVVATQKDAEGEGKGAKKRGRKKVVAAESELSEEGTEGETGVETAPETVETEE